jgi:hypothetical protein
LERVGLGRAAMKDSRRHQETLSPTVAGQPVETDLETSETLSPYGGGFHVAVFRSPNGEQSARVAGSPAFGISLSACLIATSRLVCV